MGLRKLSGQKTYWHMLGARKKPSAYDIASSKLHYYPTLGFGVTTPVGAWYERHQFNSAFKAADLEAFGDPRRTTYASYTQLQEHAEAYLDGVLAAADEAGDRALDAVWTDVLARIFAPLRYPCHALSMLAAYLGSMAPESKVTIAAGFQMADEIRRVNALARRLHQLRRAHPGLGDDARVVWEQDSAWQGVRRFVERALVAYDWSECFVVLNLVLKPSFDQLFIHCLAAAARIHDDATTAQVLATAGADSQWQRDWSRAMLHGALERAPAARHTVESWVAHWSDELDAALLPLGALIDATASEAPADGAQLELACEAARARTAYLSSCGLEDTQA